MTIITVAIDLAKNVFSLHGVDTHGRIALRRTVRRDQLAETVAKLPSASLPWRRARGRIIGRAPSLENEIEQIAQGHDPFALSLLRSTTGIGQVLALSIPYEIGRISRFPRVQELLSYGRLVKPTQESSENGSRFKSSRSASRARDSFTTRSS